MIIDCKDSFNHNSFLEVCKALNEGKDVQIGTSCSDAVMDSFQGAHYASELYSVYGNRLQRLDNDVFYHSYKLREL